jgi:hypothetical protein
MRRGGKLAKIDDELSTQKHQHHVRRYTSAETRNARDFTELSDPALPAAPNTSYRSTNGQSQTPRRSGTSNTTQLQKMQCPERGVVLVGDAGRLSPSRAEAPQERMKRDCSDIINQWRARLFGASASQSFSIVRTIEVEGRSDGR